VKIWDLGTGVCLNTIQTGGVGVQCVGDAIVTGSMERTIKVTKSKRKSDSQRNEQQQKSEDKTFGRKREK
jgi:hypothetical protein